MLNNDDFIPGMMEPPPSVEQEANIRVSLCDGPRVVYSILVLDHYQRESSVLYRAFLDQCKGGCKYPYHIIHRRIEKKSGRCDLGEVERLLSLNCEPITGQCPPSMLRLRGIVFDTHAVCADETLCQLIRASFPSIFVAGVGNGVGGPQRRSVDIESRYECRRIDTGGPSVQGGVANILRMLDERLDADFHSPYWEALSTYVTQQNSNFHSLPVGLMHSASSSISDFINFYGKGVFSGETSLSTFPLDSLLNPQGPIQQAQVKAARAFGATLFAPEKSENYGTRFVTTGTSSANRIVLSTYVRPNDIVLLDRSCHISHYYSLAYSHARPVLVEPDYNSLGIALPPSIDRLKSSFARLLDEFHRLPAALILTNPTFDGVYCQPQSIVKAFRSVLSAYWRKHRGTPRLQQLIGSMPRAITETAAVDLGPQIEETTFLVTAFRCIVFLFDEAWSAHAFFHPRLVRYTAMHASIELAREDPEVYGKGLRFYATQSTHKSLSAFRQGSMIHYRDPIKHLPDFEQLFAQSFRAHTTTSPNANIIASLDVARRQAQIDGLELVERCFRLATEFRRSFSPAARPAGYGFRTVDDRELLADRSPTRTVRDTDDYFVDPARVTITWDFGLCGSEVRRLLLERGIQVNRFESRSILVIFHIGSSDASVAKLRNALLAIEQQCLDKHPNKRPAKAGPGVPPPFRRMHDDHNLGWWLKNLGEYHRHILDVEQCAQDMLAARFNGKRLVAANFGIPYPPGYPILIPGQVVGIADLRYLSRIAEREILGAHRVDGRLKMAFYLFSDDATPTGRGWAGSDVCLQGPIDPGHFADASGQKDQDIDEH